MSRRERRVVYKHLNGQITTRTRPSGGLICEILFPSRTKPHEALPCIMAVEVLLRAMQNILLKERSRDEQHRLVVDATRATLEGLEKDGAKRTARAAKLEARA